MSATACARRVPCSFDAIVHAALGKHVEEVLHDPPLVAQERGLGDVQRAGQTSQRLDRGLDVAVLVPGEPSLGDAGELLELGLAEACAERASRSRLPKCLPSSLVVHEHPLVRLPVPGALRERTLAQGLRTRGRSSRVGTPVTTSKGGAEGPARRERCMRSVVRCYLTSTRRAGGLELLLGLVGGLLGDLLQDRLGGTVHEVLGLLEAEAGEGAHLLDDLDLLVSGPREDHVELVLLLGGLAAAARRRRRPS